MDAALYLAAFPSSRRGPAGVTLGARRSTSFPLRKGGVLRAQPPTTQEGEPCQRRGTAGRGIRPNRGSPSGLELS